MAGACGGGAGTVARSPHSGGSGHPSKTSGVRLVETPTVSSKPSDEPVPAHPPLAQIASKRAKIDRQVDVLTVREPLGQSLIRRFILEGREISLQPIDRALSEAARKAASARSTITHFVPCHLMTALEPACFNLGPVTFIRKSEFRRLLAQHLWSTRAEQRKNRKPIGDGISYYKTFGWVAQVTIVDCDKPTSKLMAERTVTAALNCIHLVFGTSHNRKMVVGGPALQHDRRGGFTIEGGNLHVEAQYGWPGAVGVEDDWIKYLNDDEGRHIVELCGIALEAAVDPTKERPLSDRFLDAAHWYGEAVREMSAPAKVIKYVTALERMFMTDEKDNIADTVAERVATFCFDPSVTGDFERTKDCAKKAYDLRSRLAHGSMSPSDPTVWDGVRLGAELGQQALLAGLDAFEAEGLREEAIGRKRVAEWFQAAVGHGELVRSNLAATADE